VFTGEGEIFGVDSTEFTIDFFSYEGVLATLL
jgi:hypothetical protein